MSVIGVGETILARAALIEPATARSLDAVHLATAIEVGGFPASILAYDVRMAAAARSLGLPVVGPA